MNQYRQRYFFLLLFILLFILFASIKLFNHYYYGPNIVFEIIDYNDIDVECPCQSHPTIDSESLQNYYYTYNICIIKANDHHHLYTLLQSYFNITFISTKSMNTHGNNCTHYITFKHINISSTAYNAITMKCPQECHHIPLIIIPLNFEKLHATYRLTCSMTKQTLIEALNIPSNRQHLYRVPLESHNKYMYTHVYNNSTNNSNMYTNIHIPIIHIIQLMIERRYQECHESQPYTSPTPTPSPTTTTHTTNTTTVYNNTSITYNTQYIFEFPRLKVEGLILWIGCLKKYDLGIQQMNILEHQLQLQHANNMWLHTRQIVGWLATESIYTCYNEDIVYKCIHSNPRRNMPFVHLYGNNSMSDPKWRYIHVC